MKRHAQDKILVKQFKEDYDIDLIRIIEDNTRSLPKITHFNENLQCPNHGYSLDEYFRHGGCGEKIKEITTPTLFMHALDDPIVGVNGIDFD